MSRRVVHLHIGAPKTGTTYLQDRLALNARSLARHGVHFPTSSPLVSPGLFQFRAALDLLGEDWGGHPGHAVGSWDVLARKVRRRSGRVIISHEILAPARPDQVARALRDLEGSEVHIVYSARDLGRQLPAAWQESIKQGRKWTYRRFLDRAEKGRPWFYRAFDLPTVLETWGATLPPERVHVVTVPRRGVQERQGNLLWDRFCEVFGIDPAWAPRDSDRTNRSLGVAETQLIRQLNRRMDRATRREAHYDSLIREMLAQDELVNRDSAAVRLPPGRYPWAEEQAERWIEWIERSGVDVVGDLKELRPVRPPEDQGWHDPDRVGAKAQLNAALDAAHGDDPRGRRAPRPQPPARQPDSHPGRAAPAHVTAEADEHTPGERRAWGWVAHLRDGGTTPWRAWTGAGVSGGRILPGAQQLELLRRLNEVGAPSPTLAARVLGASAPGRGRPDLELVGAAEESSFGPRPVDPADLPDDELVRVATSVLADDIVAAGLPPAPSPALVRPWRTRYRIVGDPVLADPIRDRLVAGGRPPGGRGSRVLVIGTDLETMFAHAWTARAFDAGGPGWEEWLRTLVERNQVAPRVDLLRAARTWSDLVGRERVHVVLDPAAVARLVGVRRPFRAPDELSADAVDLARRVASVLGLLVTPDRRAALLNRTLRPRLVGVGGPPLVVPPEHRDWLRRRAVRMRDGLVRAGYAVHGDPDTLLPDDRAGVVDPSDAGVLALALRMLLDGDAADHTDSQNNREWA